jgi:Transcription factor WhiB
VATSQLCTRARHDACGASYCGCTCHKPAVLVQPVPKVDAETRLAGIRTAALLGIVLDGSDSWRDRAACRDAPLSVFYVEPNRKRRGAPPGTIASDARDLQYCARCPVRSECLDEQLRWEAGGSGRRAGHLATGILGGTKPAMRKNRRIKGLPIEQRKAALLAWFTREVLPRLTEESETLAS